MHPSPRIRRLNSDRKALEQLRDSSTVFTFEATGDPPDFYRLKFLGKGLARGSADQPVYVQTVHEIHMRLGANYPRQMPELSWKTPIFHPNISAGGFVCLGGYGTHWTPGVTLDELCCMLWDMIRYENYDVTSPYNREAAGWVNEQTMLRLPLDHRPLRDRIATETPLVSPTTDAEIPPHQQSSAGGPLLDWHAPESPFAPLHSAVRPTDGQPAARGRSEQSPTQTPAATHRYAASDSARSSHRGRPVTGRMPPPPIPPVADPGVIFLDEEVLEAECVSTDAGSHSVDDGDIVFLS